MRAKGKKPDGRYYLFANDPRTGVILSVMLEQSQQADANSCPAYLQQRIQSVSKLGIVATDVKSSESNSLALVEYTIPTMEGKSVQQKNIVACAARDGVFVDIHLSKSQFQQSDEALLMDVLNQVQISNPGAPGASHRLAHQPLKTSSNFRPHWEILSAKRYNRRMPNQQNRHRIRSTTVLCASRRDNKVVLAADGRSPWASA